MSSDSGGPGQRRSHNTDRRASMNARSSSASETEASAAPLSRSGRTLRDAAETKIVEAFCQAAVRNGPFTLVAVACAAEKNGQLLQAIAWATAGSSRARRCAWPDLPGGGGPLAIAWRSGERFHTTGRGRDEELAGWFLAAPCCGAVAAFPLIVGSRLIGAVGFGRAAADVFDPSELDALSDLVADIGKALAALRGIHRTAQVETQTGRIHRALHTLSAANRTLLRAQSEPQLLAEMCAVIVEEGGYPAAWVGYAEHDERRTIRVMAHSGSHSDTLEAMQLTWSDTGVGVGPTGAAIRSGKPVIGRNLHADPRLTAAVNALLGTERSDDYAAASVFPLRVDGEVIGNLSIYAAEAEAFDDDEARLLGEMADDLAYGIAVQRTRQRHREAEATIRHMAYHDAVTGLPNRVRLREELDAAIAGLREQRRPLALLVLKVEQFQEISDSLGHVEGSRLLEEVATRLQRILGEDELLARGAEDEFVILARGRGAAHAGAAAQRMGIALSEPIELSGLSVSARASIGIALAPGHGTDADALIRRASVAACQARSSGTGYAIYTGGLDEDCTRRLALMGELRRAIDQNALQLYLQPKVGIASARVCGAEALVRWSHPQRGPISTAEFVKLAEQAGLIGSLTHWVLDAAFAQAYAWHEAGFDQAIAVNLSAHDLRDPLLVDHVQGLFATWGARPEWIQFELTESALMQDPGGTLETLKRLKKVGVELFIDDYGTGYSSLSYLQRLPVDAIKIDQSFVGSMTDDSDSATIVRSTIELGHNLSLRVCAEGVENEAIWTGLAGLGCDAAQGYFVSRPLPAEEFANWARNSPWH